MMKGYFQTTQGIAKVLEVHQVEPELRRRECRPDEVEAALCALDLDPTRIRARDWPAGLQGLEQAGLYSWWVDAEGAADLSAGIGATVAAGRIYAGQTGATAWPSGQPRSTTLRGRIGGNHLHGRIRGSTFRLTLAAALCGPLGLTVTAPRRLDRESERRLGEWMREHLEAAVFAFPERDALGHLEDYLLAHLDPPLNIKGMPPTPLRRGLSELREALSRSCLGGCRAREWPQQNAGG